MPHKDVWEEYALPLTNKTPIFSLTLHLPSQALLCAHAQGPPLLRTQAGRRRHECPPRPLPRRKQFAAPSRSATSSRSISSTRSTKSRSAFSSSKSGVASSTCARRPPSSTSDGSRRSRRPSTRSIRASTHRAARRAATATPAVPARRPSRASQRSSTSARRRAPTTWPTSRSICRASAWRCCSSPGCPGECTPSSSVSVTVYRTLGPSVDRPLAI